MLVAVEIRHVYLCLRTSDSGRRGTRPGPSWQAGGRDDPGGTARARRTTVLYRRSTWLKAPSSGSTPTRATASSPLTTEPPTCSSTTPPSRLTASAACRTTSGSATPPGGAPRARRPRKSARSDRLAGRAGPPAGTRPGPPAPSLRNVLPPRLEWDYGEMYVLGGSRSEEHTSELQSRGQLVCRPLPE